MIKSIILLLVFFGGVAAQNIGRIQGHVLDPAGQPVPGVRLTANHPLSGLTRQTTTADTGAFSLDNLPYNTYRLTATKDGFALWQQSVAIQSALPVAVAISLQLHARSAVVEVRERDHLQLIDPAETGTRTQMSLGDIEKMALQIGNRGLESVLLTFPGFAQNANGAIHPRGAHNQMTFVIDGLPITDQLTGAFANAVDPSIVQTVELFTGNIPAEYGNKVSAVAQVTTKSGLGAGRPAAGSLLLSGAEPFDTANALAQIAGESKRLGYSASFNAMQTHRYLDQVSLDNLNNGGHSQRAYARLDYQATPRDLLRLNLMAGRSAFQLANLRSQHAAGMNARQALADASGALVWQRTLNASTLWESFGSWRTSTADLFPSAFDTPIAAWQARRLATYTVWNRLSLVRGGHTLKAGIDAQTFPLRERFAISDPDFRFDERGRGTFYSAFLQDQFRWKRWQVAAGFRQDRYSFLTRGWGPQPRIGIAYQLIEGRTVLRASYNRLYQTPPNENLLIANSEVAARLFAPLLLAAGAFRRIQPERQNFFELGLQQAIAGRASLSLAYYHKASRDQQDNNSFFNTPIIFPTSLAQMRVNGAEARLVLPTVRGFGGTLSLTHARAITTPPFTGGLFIGQDSLALLSAGPFVIDHDQRLSVHGVLTWTSKRGWFSTLSTRHDSGLVANPSDPAEVAADPDYADLLPYVNLLSRPARTRPRTVTDVMLGYLHTRHERRRWEASAQLSNLTNVTALYNFQSVFVGTRLIQPRSAGLRLRWFF
jgi:outer membrane cobalamin receptor